MFSQDSQDSTAPRSATGPAPGGDPAEPEKTVVDGVVREVSVPALVPPVPTGSLGDLPFANATEAPGDIVLARKQPSGAWRDISAAEFAAEVRAVAKGLIAHGLRPGDRLAIMARTTYEWTLVDFAAWAAGLVTVPLYPTSSAHQAQWILHDSGATACVVESVEEARLISGIRGELPGLAHLWQFDAGAVAQLVSAGRALPDAEVEQRLAAVGPDALATLIYTSGTTGRPKGCVLTHANFFAEVDNAVALLHPVFTSRQRRARIDAAVPAAVARLRPHGRHRLSAGPGPPRPRAQHPDRRSARRSGHLPAHVPAGHSLCPGEGLQHRTGHRGEDGPGRLLRPGRADRPFLRRGGRGPGARHRPRPGYRPQDGQKALRPPGLPPHPGRPRRQGPPRHLRWFPPGAPARRLLLRSRHRDLRGLRADRDHRGGDRHPAAAPRIGTVGRPLPGTAVRIAEDGEVLLRGGQVFAGYWDAELGAAGPATDRGWFATGDLGALDADGYLTITGRKKEILVTTGGKNVAPAPLEDRLRAHPLVGQCMVVGDNRSYITALLTLEPDGLAHWQQMHKKRDVPLAELVRDERLLADLQHAVDDANKLVSRAESIRRFAVLPVDFTEQTGHLTPSLKLRRAAVARDFAKEIEGLYQRT